MTLRDCFQIPLITLCFLVPTVLACSDDPSKKDGTESETGDGDGDGDAGDGDGESGDGEPGDGDSGDGDGDGEPGDGDGEPGDGDGEPGDGDGDGDGESGDGDGDPGICDPMDATWGAEDCFNPRGWFWDGESCQQIYCTCVGSDCNALYPDEAACLADRDTCLSDAECAPFDAEGVGPCDAFFGYSWTGKDCVGISGCNCVGTDCDQLYDDFTHCWSVHGQCELNDACDPDDAAGVGPCAAFFGYAWNGHECVGLSGCECVGSDCPNLSLELTECEAQHAECMP